MAILACPTVLRASWGSSLLYEIPVERQSHNERSLHATRISKEKLGHTLELRFARQTGQTSAEGFIIAPDRITTRASPAQTVIVNSTVALSTGGTPRTHTRSRDSSSR